MKGREAAQEEYDQARAGLTLPPGAPDFPTTIPEDQEPTVYEEGVASTLAETYWLCAWEKEWLAQRSSDAERAATALMQLERAPETKFMREHLDQIGRDYFQEYLTKARLGDPSGFQQDVSVNCVG